MILWDGEPPRGPRDDGTLVGAFLVLTFAMWIVVVLGMMFRG